MKILVINIFHYVRGGAERYALELSDLLKSRGHQVVPFSQDHPRNLPSPYAQYFASYINFPELLHAVNPANIAKATGRAIYSREVADKLAQLIEITQPDIAHVHNIAFALTPSVLYVLARAGIPVVQTLHDYKILCPNTIFTSQGEICERCKGGRFYQVVWQRCKRGSLSGSVLACLEAYIHHWLDTYRRKVDTFISPSNFLRQKMIEFGFPADQVVHLPYTIYLARYQPATGWGSYVLYFGRLADNKGLYTLLKAIAQHPNVALKIAGEGPLGDDLQTFARQNGLANVDFVGYQSGEALHDLIRGAAFVVVPSEWYENSPLACYEAMALGRPVIGANIGGIPELVQEGETGLLFESRNADDLADKIGFLLSRPALRVEWGRNARRRAEAAYNPDDHYQAIMATYCRLARRYHKVDVELPPIVEANSVDDTGQGL